MNITKRKTKIMENSDFDMYYDDLLENSLLEYCPACGELYDDIDFEYQVCHYCKHDGSQRLK